MPRDVVNQMNPNTNAWNRIRYGLYAPYYDVVARLLDPGRILSIGAVALSSGERVLIPGCGTGLDFPHLPRDVGVTAGDLSPAMVRRAASRAERLGMEADVRVLDAHALDLPDSSVDAVFLHLILAVVPDPVAAVREAARVLKPGGRIGVFDKFLDDDAKASPLRRAAGVVTNVVATDLNRKLGPLVASGGLILERDVARLYGGLFRVVVLRKAV